ncbi:MAG TPA: serine hydrolase [Acetobacteraceae bacterium]
MPGKPRRLRHWFWSAIVLVAVSGTWLSANAQTVTPEQVSAALPALDAMAQDVVSSGAVPGLAIAVVSHDKVVFLKGYGLREAGRPETVDADTVFQLASLSKPISSSVVAALVTAGVVRWDSRISDLDPGFRLFDAYPTEQVTVRDLFAHRSGLPGSAGDDLETIGFDRKTIAYRLRLVPPSSSFRAGYSYSNFGLTEGAVAAARPTGKDWETVAEDFLYRPLGMTMTSSRYSDFVARTDRAALHIKVNGAWAAKLQRDPDAQSPAGGVSSSVRDLAQWVRLELGDGMFDGTRLISSDAIGETHQPLVARGNNLVTGAASFYALGWNVEYGRHGLSWGHAGAFSLGARTLVTLYPQADFGIVVLTNAFPTGVPEGIADSFADLVFDGHVAKDWFKPWDAAFESILGQGVAAALARYGTPPASASPAMPEAAYVGRYNNAYVGDAVVSDVQGTLVLHVGPNGARTYPLRHFDRDTFVYFPDEETPEVPAAARFTIGPDGRATNVTLEPLDQNGLGTLARAKD